MFKVYWQNSVYALCKSEEKAQEIQNRAFKTTHEQAEFAVSMGVIAQAQVKAGQLQTLINSIKHDEKDAV